MSFTPFRAVVSFVVLSIFSTAYSNELSPDIPAALPNAFLTRYATDRDVAGTFPYVASMTAGTCDTAGPIEIESSGGTTTPTAYATLGAAFTAINGGVHTGSISIDVCGDTNEGATSATLNASGSGSASYTSITMSPAGGSARTITGATTAGAPMIDLNGADNVTINGLNAGGNSLTIANTTISATSGTATIRFIGGATGNTITNSNLQGSGTMSVATNGAVVFFSTDANTANGNDNNTISNNNIGPAGANLPTKAILGNGSTTTTAIGNSGIIIDNNNIFDFFGAAVTSSGIATNGGCNTWTITNNRLYQTGTRTWTTGASHIGIDIRPTTATSGAQGFTITGNTIGYASNTQTGTYTLTGAGTSAKFVGILFNGISTGTTTNVNNNTVAAVSLTGVTSSGTSTASPFTGILFQEGNGVTNGNTVGSPAAAGSMTFSTTTTSGTDVYGIYNFSSNAWTSNTNNIGGISVTNLGASGTFLVYGMRAFTASTTLWSATSNNIGGTVANSIQLSATGTASQVVGMFTSNAPGSLTSNTIRNLTTNIGTGTTTAASVAGIITSSGTPNYTFSQNTIHSLTNTNTTAASVVTGIQYVGNTANTVERNLIYNLTSATNAAGAEVNGIRTSGGTSTIRNNMIVLGAGISNALGGPAAVASTAGINGIVDIAGTNNVLHNSVYIGGSPTAGSGSSFAFNDVATGNTRSYRDNIFFNARSNSGTANGKNYAIKVNAAVPNPVGLTLNNNIYFVNGVGGVFGFFAGADVANLSAWKAGVGQDGNSFEAHPQYLDPTNAIPDLHLNPAITTVAEGNGADVGVANDFDGQTRASLTPVDIGADAGNFMGLDLSPPSINYAPFTNTALSTNRTLSVTLSDATGVATGGLAPRIYFNKNAGVYSSTACVLTSGTTNSGTWDCTIDNTLLGGVVAADVVRYFVVAQDTLGNLGANPSAGVSGTDVNTITSPPTTPNQYTIVQAFNGPINVGTGEIFTSLTNAGGIFEAINNGSLTGNVTINITSDLAGELGTVALNQFAEDGVGGFTILIKPIGAPRTITGTNTGALIRLSGADRVRFDGSTASSFNEAAENVVGGNPALRELTIQNTNTGTSAVVISVGSNATNGAQNNTIQNVNVLGQDPTTTLIGISLGGATPGTVATGPNNGNRVENCSLRRSILGIYSAGASAASPNTGTVITQNETSAVSGDRIRRIGILVFNDNGIQITENSLNGISTNESLDGIGIGVGTQAMDTTTTTSGGITNALVERNRVNGVASLSGTGFSAAGITIAGAVGGANIIRNNMVTGVTAPSTSPDLPAGIYVVGAAGSVTRVYHNSIAMTGDRGAAAFTGMPSFGIAVTGADPSVELKNNIFYTTQTASGGGINAKSYAIGMVTTTFANLDSNYNDFFSSGVNAGFFRSGSLGSAAGTDYANLSAWQTAVSDDANSQELDPVYVDPLSDLHLSSLTTPLLGDGITGFATNDFDGETRDNPPDIGADEIVADATLATDYFRSVATGNWNANATWESSHDNNTWIAATMTPTSAANTITIRTAHIVTATAAAGGDQIVIQTGATLQVGVGVTFTVNDGTGSDVTVDSGGIFASAGSLPGTGQVQVNGTFRIDEGNNPIVMAGTYAYDPSTATLVYNNSAGLYSFNGEPYWPAVSGPQNVTVQNTGGLSIGPSGVRTVGGNFITSRGVSNADRLTLNGLFEINTGGFVTGSPTLGPASLLRYNTGGTYGRAGEWLPNTTSGAGYPHNVELANNTTLDLPNGSSAFFQMSGTLTVNAGSNMNLNGNPAMTQALRVLGSVSNTGTITLSSASGGDLQVGGNWTNSGTLTHNGRIVSFNGAGAQAINGSTTFAHLAITTLTSRTITFQAGSTQNVTSSLTLAGAAANLLSLRSSASPTRWNINAPSTFIADYVDVQDSDASGGQTIVATNSTNSGNNINWVFGSPDISIEQPVGNILIDGVSTVGYSNVTVGNTLTKEFTIRNTGTTTLNVGAIGVTGGNAGDFVVDTTGLVTVVAPLGNTAFRVRFTPSAAGARSTSLQIASDDPDENPFDIGLTGNGVAPVCTPPPANMAAWYRAENNANDSIGTNNGTLQNGVAFAAGKVNQAFKFDGVDDYVNVPDSASLQIPTNVSIDFWAKRQRDGVDMVAEKGGDWTLGQTNYGVGFHNSGFNSPIYFFWAGGGKGVPAPTDGQWHHYAITAVNGQTNPKFYIDGVEETNITFTFGSSTINLVTGTQPLHIGAQPNVFPVFGQNFIDELEIFNGILSATDVQNIYNAGSAGKCQSGTLQFSSPTYSVGEAGPTATITVTRTGGSQGAVGVTYATSNGTATGGASCAAGIDYVSTTNTLSWADGDSVSKTFNVSTCDDALSEGDETVNLALSSPTGGAVLGAQSNSVLTINDNDGAPSLQFATATDSVSEAGGSITFSVTRTGATGNAVSVNYATASGTATSGASCVAGVDFTGASGTLNFASGEVLKTFNVTICNDNLFESNETFTATLSSPGGGAVIGAPSVETVTITENDTAPTFVFSSSTYSVGEGGGTSTITVNRTGATENAVSVNFASVAGGTATGGASCGAGVDYQNASGTLNFASGDTSKTFNVTTCDDNLFESSETVNLALSSPGAPAMLGSPSTATLTITENDTAPTFQFSSATYSNGDDLSVAPEVATITVTRTGATENAVSVNFATVAGGTATAGGACAAGSGVDFVSISGTLAFASGDLSKTFNVTVCTDNLFEGNETVNLALSSPTAPAVLGTPNTAVLTITDNDSQPSLQLSSATYSVGEGAGSATITVTRTGATDNVVSVNYATSNGTATGGASCVAGVDYQNASGTLNFAFGVTSQTFNVTICDDALAEGSETVNLALTMPAGGAVLGAPGASVLTITDNDGDTIAPVVTYTPISANPPLTMLTANITDAVGVTSATIFWKINAGSFTSAPCILVTGNGQNGNWDCVITGAINPSAVSYYVTASDAATNTGSSPVGGASSPNLFTIGAATIPAGTYTNLRLGPGVTLGGNVNVLLSVDLAGVIDTGNNTLTLECNAALTGGGEFNYVVGNLEKLFCSTGAFTFHVGGPALPPLNDGEVAVQFVPEGAASNYSPVTANITGGTVGSSLAVKVFDTGLVGFDPSRSISRNWLINESGSLTADLAFTYRNEDVAGNEADYRVYRYPGAGPIVNMCPSAPCVNTGTNTASVTGVTVFSRWTVAELLVPTAAHVTLSGRVTDASGRGVRNAAVVLEGPGIQARRTATGSFGFYVFEDVPVGNYFVTVHGKRYTFAVPTRTVALFESLSDVDFVAEPLE